MKTRLLIAALLLIPAAGCRSTNTSRSSPGCCAQYRPAPVAVAVAAPCPPPPCPPGVLPPPAVPVVP